MNLSNHAHDCCLPRSATCNVSGPEPSIALGCPSRPSRLGTTVKAVCLAKIETTKETIMAAMQAKPEEQPHPQQSSLSRRWENSEPPGLATGQSLGTTMENPPSQRSIENKNSFERGCPETAAAAGERSPWVDLVHHATVRITSSHLAGGPTAGSWGEGRGGGDCVHFSRTQLPRRPSSDISDGPSLTLTKFNTGSADHDRECCLPRLTA